MPSRGHMKPPVEIQENTGRIILGAGGLQWTGLFRAGTVRFERKGEQARDLLRADVLSCKTVVVNLLKSLEMIPWYTYAITERIKRAKRPYKET